MRRALAIDQASYGPDRPSVARDLSNLAQLLQATNRLKEAEPLYRRAVEILSLFHRITGHQHPDSKTIQDNYSRLLQGNADTEPTLSFLARVRKSFQK